MKILSQALPPDPFALFRDGLLQCPSCGSALQVEESDSPFVVQDKGDFFLDMPCPVDAFHLRVAHQNLQFVAPAENPAATTQV